MALITDATTGWSSPVTLTQDEVWQTRSGNIFLTTTPGASADDGVFLRSGRALLLSAGTEVRYRKEGRTSALIAREAV